MAQLGVKVTATSRQLSVNYPSTIRRLSVNNCTLEACYRPLLTRANSNTTTHRLGQHRKTLYTNLSTRRSHTGLPHIFSAALLIGHLALLIRLVEQHLSDTFVGINLSGQRRSVRKF